MPTIKIIREGRQIGILEIGDSSEKFTVLPSHEGGERGLVIVAELDKVAVAGLLFRLAEESIDISEPLRLSSERLSELNRYEEEPRQGIRDMLPLWELIGAVNPFREGGITEFSLRGDWCSRFPISLEINDDFENGFFHLRFRGYAPYAEGFIRGRFHSEFSHGSFRIDLLFEGVISHGRMSSELRAELDGTKFTFHLESRQAFGYGDGLIKGDIITALPLLWLLQETVKHAADLEREGTIRIQTGLIGLTSDDIHRWELREKRQYLGRELSASLPLPVTSRQSKQQTELNPIEQDLAAKRPSVLQSLLSALPKLLSVFRKSAEINDKALPNESDLLNKLAKNKSAKLEVRQQPEVNAESTQLYQVDCTVFAPNLVRRKQSGLLQVFIHAPEDQKQAKAKAREFDRNTTERGHRTLVMDATIGTHFGFDVEIEGFVLKQRTDSLFWDGRPQAATFPFEVPRFCKLGQHTGTVWISKEGVPVGRIGFQIEVKRDASDACYGPTGDEARHYHACFCSYSSLDRAEMLKRAQGLRAAGLETFIDVLNLRPGDEWNPKIFEAIDKCDLFVLIWSNNARKSKWVLKEARHAVERYKKQRSPDFRPIPIDGPPIASVPRSLRTYHFNEDTLFLIRASEIEAQERAKQTSTENIME